MSADQPVPSHHPAEDLVVAHAAGQLDLSRRVMMEAHLELCPRCREDFQNLVEPGRRWLEEHAVVAPKPVLLDRLMARLDDDPLRDDLVALDPELPLPRAARLELETTGRRPRWRPLPLSSARFSILHYDRAEQIALTLVRIPGGHRFPRHQHLGTEDVLVLRGAYRDPDGHFHAGDYQQSEPGTEHAPDIDAGERCWILARYEKGIRFHGLRGLIQRWSSR